MIYFKKLCGIGIFIISSVAFANDTHEMQATRYFNQIKNNPLQLFVFLQRMPKGADLHNHLGGASMAENLIQYSSQDSLCVDKTTYTLSVDPQCSPSNLLPVVSQEVVAKNAMIDAWSMRNFRATNESPHDHFFAAFRKYNPISSTHSGEILTEVVNRAGQQNESYLELMMTPDRNASGALGKTLAWNNDFDAFRKTLIASGLNDIIKQASKTLDDNQAFLEKSLACGTTAAAPGCQVNIRFLYQVSREQPPAAVFSQLMTGFELATKDSRIVGVNMVQPEDGIISMRDYALQMQMVGYLHTLYPTIPISLHAGELTSSLVSPDGLRFHIRSAVEIGQARRIGHGVDVAYEDDADSLLKEMARKHILVEVNLSSSENILDAKGPSYPFDLYCSYHVPLALSTDDEGVLRTNLTREYQKAILIYRLSYVTVKNLARNSIAYSFLPGQSLWRNDQYQQIVFACSKDNPIAGKLSKSCELFLKSSEKATQQWDLEKRFAVFEHRY